MPPNKHELGITKEQIAAIQSTLNRAIRQCDAIAPTHIRQAIDKRLVEIKLLIRDGHTRNKNGGS